MPNYTKLGAAQLLIQSVFSEVVGFCTACFSELGERVISALRGNRTSALQTHLLDFRYAASFRNESAFNWTGVANRNQILHSPFPVKIMARLREMSESTFPAQ